MQAAGGNEPVLAKYLPGVGTQGDLALKILGNLFGDGIAEPIIRGYTYLSRQYKKGDKIIIIGFSRGATAARALAGLIVGQGLLDTQNYNSGEDDQAKNGAYIRAIAAWYLYRKEKPDFASNLRIGIIEGLLGTQKLPVLQASDFVPDVPIKAVGVFDTVSSLGLPQLQPDGVPTFDFSICSTELSDKVEFGFHALAADEMRDLFSPTFWASRKESLIQEIFPGCHSDVGGGYPNRGLSDHVLGWMTDHLRGVGLNCDMGKLSPTFVPDPMAPAQDDGQTFPFNGTPRSGRAFPECAVASAALIRRWGHPTEMLPTTKLQPYAAKGAYADGRPLYVMEAPASTSG
jgi:glutathione S-transferase